jgi:hypothetical protein
MDLAGAYRTYRLLRTSNIKNYLRALLAVSASQGLKEIANLPLPQPFLILVIFSH